MKFNRNLLFLIILIAFLIHLVLIYEIRIWQYIHKPYNLKKSPDKKKESLPKEKHEHQKNEDQFDWVAGNAAGAPVIYYEEPEIEQKSSQEENVDTTSDQQKSDEKSTQDPENTEKKDSIKQEKETAEIQEIKELLKNTYADEDEKKSPPSPITLAQKTSALKKKKKSKTKLTLADITKGFITRLGEQSEHHVSVLSNKQGKPTAEQLNYERYIGKLFSCMQKSIKIHNHSLTLSNHLNTSVYFSLSLARNGSLVNVAITKGSGIQSLDDFVIFIVKDAASSFPPVPSSIKATQYPLGFIINQMPDNYMRVSRSY